MTCTHTERVLFSLCLLLLLLFSVFVQKEEWPAGEEKQVTSIAECNAKKKEEAAVWFQRMRVKHRSEGKAKGGDSKIRTKKHQQANKQTEKRAAKEADFSRGYQVAPLLQEKERARRVWHWMRCNVRQKPYLRIYRTMDCRVV